MRPRRPRLIVLDLARAAELHPSILAEVGRLRRKLPTGRPGSGAGPVWQGAGDAHLRGGAIAELCRIVGATLTRHVGTDLVTVEAWPNVNHPGGCNRPHTHGDECWSAVYFVEADAAAGSLVFWTDDRHGGAWSGRPYLEIVPHPGLLVGFPGWLTHSVRRNEGDGPRVSVAVNFGVGLPAWYAKP